MNIICLINRLSLFAGKAVLSGSVDLFILYMHGFSAGGTVENTMKEIIKRAEVPHHDGWSVVNDFLHPRPFLRQNNGFIAALYDLPFFHICLLHYIEKFCGVSQLNQVNRLFFIYMAQFLSNDISTSA